MVPSTRTHPEQRRKGLQHPLQAETSETDASTYVTMKARRCQPKGSRNLSPGEGILWLVNLLRRICV